MGVNRLWMIAFVGTMREGSRMFEDSEQLWQALVDITSEERLVPEDCPFCEFKDEVTCCALLTGLVRLVLI